MPNTMLATRLATAIADLPFLTEPLGLQHPGGERGVGTDEGGVGEQRGVPAQRQAAKEAEKRSPADVHRQRSERERARRASGHRAVHQKPQHRPGAAGDQDANPDVSSAPVSAHRQRWPNTPPATLV